MEVKWPVFMAECVDEHYGVHNPTGGGTLEYAIGRMKNGQCFYGIFYDMELLPEDDIGEVFWFDNEEEMKSHLILAGQNPDDLNFSPEIVEELLRGYKDL